jgi:hypothetical protein
MPVGKNNIVRRRSAPKIRKAYSPPRTARESASHLSDTVESKTATRLFRPPTDVQITGKVAATRPMLDGFI